MKPRKLTDAMRAEVRTIVMRRHAIPTNGQLAAKWGCCKKIVDDLSAQIGAQLQAPRTVDSTLSIVPCGTSVVDSTSSNVHLIMEPAQ